MFSTYFKTLLDTNPTKFREITRAYMGFQNPMFVGYKLNPGISNPSKPFHQTKPPSRFHHFTSCCLFCIE